MPSDETATVELPRWSVQLTGIDRVGTRNGLVSENVIVFDTAAFRAGFGKEIPCA